MSKDIETALKGRIELWPIGSIKPYDLNAKIHDEAQVTRIAKSITDFGWDQPIVVDRHGVIIKGHGRRLAAIKLGMPKVPVWVRDDLTDEQVRASRLADNRVAVGNIDTTLLQKELADLNFDLTGIFDARELDFVVADLATVNHDAFVDDIDVEVAKQAQETAVKVDATDNQDVKIDKAFGFKTVKVRDERTIARFMATIEAQFNLPAADAFVAFAKSHLETA
ncbi:ParB/Srx family N-terminal domain-containing protein [Cupriavidus campinensis]|uniref:ParB/Srx family N-terminal domain-containing protein n=1 Tax=Cupriavidus campinensis TaxID=151783 RepID=UPI001C926ADA|nr:ParB/Srx family N-terminal domain-containing protein [Cupriavidus campinensis]